MVVVAGLNGDPAYPDKEVSMPPVPLGVLGETLARGFNEKGWHWWPSDSAIATEPYDGRDKCCLLYTSPSPRDAHESRMPSSA